MKKFKLKNRIISVFGIIAILGAFFASIFSSFLGTGNSYRSSETTIAAAVDYSEYATQVVKDIKKQNLSSFAAFYNLKREYPVLAENQLPYNLCWAYSGSKALETTLMLAKDEYYNFSEAATAYFAYLSGLNNTIDSFGSFQKFDRTIREKGLVFESDFSNDISSQINETNHAAFSYIEDYADKNLPNEVIPIYLSKNSEFKNANNKTNIIKYYIQNYGGLNIALSAGTKGSLMRSNNYGDWVYEYDKISSNEGKTFTDHHAICLIGWNQRGFVGLNSWGVDLAYSYEEVLIPYDTMEMYYNDQILFDGTANEDWLCGYYFIGGENVVLTATTADEFSASIVKNSTTIKNVFNTVEPITLTYKINQIDNFDAVYVKVLKGFEDVTSRVDVSYNSANSEVSVSFTPKHDDFASSSSAFFAGGTYTIHFYEDVKTLAVKSFTVFSGTELSYAKLRHYDEKDNDDNLKFGLFYSNMNTIASSKNSFTHYINHSETYQLDLYLTDINRLSKVSGADESILNYISNFDVYDESTGQFVSGGSIQQSGILFLGNNSTNQNCYSYQITVGSQYVGKLVRYTICISSPFDRTKTQQYTFKFFVSGVPDASARNNANKVIYVTDEARNHSDNIDIYPQYSGDVMTSFELQTPTKGTNGAFDFLGWYTSPTFEESSKITKIDNTCKGTLILYAKWKYNDALYYTSSLTATNIYNYDKSEKDLTGVDISSSAQMIYGESIKLRATFNISDELKAKTFSFKYYFYLHGVKLEEVELISISDMGSIDSVYNVDFGGIGDANLAFPNLQAGSYQIEVVSVAVIRHEFSITETNYYRIEVGKKQVDLKYDVAASTFEYDKNPHLPSVLFDAETYYVEDVAEFSAVSFVQGAQNSAGTYNYLISGFTSDNYYLNPEHQAQEYKLYINKKLLSLVWTIDSAVYNGKAQKPLCDVVGVIGNDTVSVNLSGPNAVNVGEYTFTVATISTNNYYLQDLQQVVFKIVKAPLIVYFEDIQFSVQLAPTYRKEHKPNPGFTYEGTLYGNDTLESLGIEPTSLGFDSMVSGVYPITEQDDYNHQNYDITFHPGEFTLSGHYVVTYILPNGEIYKEEVEDGQEPKGVPKEILKLSIFQRAKYIRETNETSGDMYIKVTVKDYTWYVVIGGAVAGFLLIYYVASRKVRRNKNR